MRHFSQRIDLVHELRQLRTSKEVADHGSQSLRIDQLLRRDRIDTLIIHRHALANETLRAAETKTALVGEQLTHRANAT